MSLSSSLRSPCCALPRKTEPKHTSNISLPVMADQNSSHRHNHSSGHASVASNPQRLREPITATYQVFGTDAACIITALVMQHITVLESSQTTIPTLSEESSDRIVYMSSLLLAISDVQSTVLNKLESLLHGSSPSDLPWHNTEFRQAIHRYTQLHRPSSAALGSDPPLLDISTLIQKLLGLLASGKPAP